MSWIGPLRQGGVRSFYVRLTGCRWLASPRHCTLLRPERAVACLSTVTDLSAHSQQCPFSCRRRSCNRQSPACHVIAAVVACLPAIATSRTHARRRRQPPGAPLLFRLLTRRLSHTSRRHMIISVATADVTYYGLGCRLPPAFLAALVHVTPSLPFSHRPATLATGRRYAIADASASRLPLIATPHASPRPPPTIIGLHSE